MITSQVVAAHRPPPPPPLPPPPILDFVQAVAARCCLSFPLSCAAVLRICMAHQAASPPIPSRQASALASSAHVPAAARMALAAPLCTTCHRHPHPVWHRICRHRRVHACARTRSGLPPKRQWSPATATHIVFGIVYLYIKASIRHVVLHCSTSNIQTRIIRFLLRRGAHVAAAHACTNSKRQSIISHTKIAKA